MNSQISKNCNQQEINTHEKGVAGEDKACDFLISKGYRIIERNFRFRGGEVDIICQKENVLVFVEVKYFPKGSIELLSGVLNSTKQKKIIKTAKIYLEKYRQYSNDYIRFDVIAIDVPGLPSVYHIVNAFSE